MFPNPSVLGNSGRPRPAVRLLAADGEFVCAAVAVDGDGFADIALTVRPEDEAGAARIEIRSGRDGGRCSRSRQRRSG